MDFKHYTGTWRSYKAFSLRGEAKFHKENRYNEVTINADGNLTLYGFPTLERKQVLTKGSWEVRTIDGRRFFYLKGRKAFEIITFEQTDLVLQDAVTYEKTFLSSLLVWKDRIQSKKMIDCWGHIEIWSKSLIKIINLEE